MIEITVNGQTHSVDETRQEDVLLDFLREGLDLTGTKNGCHVGVCGACVVLVDNKPVRSCTRKLKQISGKSVLTIEGMESADGKLHPLQQAFIDKAAVQCGFCTPGMVLSGHALLMQNAQPTRDEIRKAINNNLCRCTGYVQIVDAIEAASKTQH